MILALLLMLSPVVKEGKIPPSVILFPEEARQPSYRIDEHTKIIVNGCKIDKAIYKLLPDGCLEIVEMEVETIGKNKFRVLKFEARTKEKGSKK